MFWLSNFAPQVESVGAGCLPLLSSFNGAIKECINRHFAIPSPPNSTRLKRYCVSIEGGHKI